VTAHSERTTRQIAHYREKRGPRHPMLKVRRLDKVGRKGKIKIRFEDGPHPGLEEYTSTRQLVVPWGQRHAVLRDEKLAAALDAHTAQVADPALGEAASAVLESTGEPGAGAAAAGTMMSESELQRIIDRAGLTATPADLHPLAYRDRHGYVHLPLEAAVELARAFAPPNQPRSSATSMTKKKRCGYAATSPANAGGTATSGRKHQASRSHVSGPASSRKPRCFARKSRAA
jgi:hypothetical protein